jgi:hypothetical protein
MWPEDKLACHCCSSQIVRAWACLDNLRLLSHTFLKRGVVFIFKAIDLHGQNTANGRRSGVCAGTNPEQLIANPLHHRNSATACSVPMAKAMARLRSPDSYTLYIARRGNWQSSPAFRARLAIACDSEPGLCGSLNILASILGLYSPMLSHDLLHLPVPISNYWHLYTTGYASNYETVALHR